ncbi:MAG: alanine--tRNA ligase [Flavobacteriaceae bacterium]|nr:MAG: alanine--tRNA ligase [Flavobacteriaceae bacterium]
MKSQEVRKQFLEFFKSKQHKAVGSAPIVIKDDPTLMFTNAGMNQFKEFFLGQRKIEILRVTDTQKCLRVSGKHNDLEEVGMDTYHHTMFEMLGNWSFGDYFKKEAIHWAWEFLTDTLKIDKDCLYVSVFEGAEEEGLKFDQEAWDLWKAIVPEDRIILGNKKDNFWEMGAQGPCGPCSEIHVDIRSAAEKATVSGRSLVNADHPQVVEIWNLVFMQFNRKANGSLENLPAQHVDTGMGFERLCMVMQGVQSNYDTDVFTPLIREVETITNTPYEQGDSEKSDIAIRVISDHVRAVAFAIADGQLPSNTGAGYVIRRILRRAVRYGFTFLNQKEPFIYRLVQVLSHQMGDTFPEIVSQQQLVTNVIKEEEASFLRTLGQGLLLLDKIIDGTEGKEISGKKAFELFDTYGFPIDLTALILSERGLTLDEATFKTELQQQKARSRAASTIETDDWVILDDTQEDEFIGYDTTTANVKVLRYRKINTKKDGDMYQLVFDKTPFYPEGGGQAGSKGYIEIPNSDVIYILDTKKENNLIIHFTKHLPNNVTDTLHVIVDENQRFLSACNHTATHLLHQALRAVLGDHIEQKGSSVNAKNLRFDFSHFAKLSNEQILEIEDFVNARITGKLPLEEFRNIPLGDAKKEGAIMLFGEKYGDHVRAIRFGQSMELCGGIHVENTSDIWHFKITSEGGVAAGIRRIEAITAQASKAFFFNNTRDYVEIKDLFKNNESPIKNVKAILEENNSLKKQVESLLKQKANNLKGELILEIKTVNGINFIAKKLDLDQSNIKDLLFEIGNEVDNLFFLAATEKDGKAMLTCYVSKELAKSSDIHAGTVVRELGKLIHGGGGGQPFFATAGGKNPAGIPAALEKAMEFLK